MKRSDFLGAIAALLTAPFVKNRREPELKKRIKAYEKIWFNAKITVSGEDLYLSFPKREG
jgi:hypothetical protein